MTTRILSTGYYLPPEVVRTDDLMAEIRPERFDLPASYLRDNVGVETVRHCDLAPSELAARAAKQALQQSGVRPDDIGMIIFCGIEGDHVEPATAMTVQAKLGLKAPICFDLSNACQGFMSGLQVANDMIAMGRAKYALVCTGERPSRVSRAAVADLKKCRDLQRLKNRVGMLTVGDAGGAMILGRDHFSQESGIKGFATDSLGKHARLCWYKWSGARLDGEMVMGKICSLTIGLHKVVYRRALELLQWDASGIDCLITHQVGARPFQLLSEAFEVAKNRMTRTYHTLGNITSATLPVNLGLAIEAGQVKPGSRIFAGMSGSGITVCHMGLVL